jgi:uncharacterized protein YqjF (DUF2071 family)
MRTLAQESVATFSHLPSEAARQRILFQRGEPLFLAHWQRVLMMHFEVDPEFLQRAIPYPLDLYQGRAFVSLVAFTMEQMRPRRGGSLAARLFRPIATHDFLNVRTYVVHRGEPGIHFLAEWLTNRLAVMLGPRVFGLPYRSGQIGYDLGHPPMLRGWVADAGNGGALAFAGSVEPAVPYTPCHADSQDEWLMERYTAFNAAGGHRRFFRVWHEPWPQRAASVDFQDLTLLTNSWPWFKTATFAGANYSPGLRDVWMGRPHKVGSPGFSPCA